MFKSEFLSIFAGVSFSLQALTIADTVREISGDDILILAPSAKYPLDETSMRNYLDNEINNNPNTIVVGYHFVTGTLASSEYFVSTRISNLAGFPTLNNMVYGVEENMLLYSYSGRSV